MTSSIPQSFLKKKKNVSLDRSDISGSSSLFPSLAPHWSRELPFYPLAPVETRTWGCCMSCWPVPHAISFLSFVQAAVRYFTVSLHNRSLSAVLSPIWGVWAIGDVLRRLWSWHWRLGSRPSLFCFIFVCLFVMYVCLCECVSVGACVEVGG